MDAKNRYFLPKIKILDIFLENSKILMEIFACSADRAASEKAFNISLKKSIFQQFFVTNFSDGGWG